VSFSLFTAVEKFSGSE